MKVFLFKVDRAKVKGYGSGEAIVAADTPMDAWDVMMTELPSYDLEYFSKESCEEIHSLTSLLTEPSLITFNCYIE